MADEENEYLEEDESIQDSNEAEGRDEAATAAEMPDDFSYEIEEALGNAPESPEEIYSEEQDTAALTAIEESQAVPDEYRSGRIETSEGVREDNETILERMASPDCDSEEKKRLGELVYNGNLGLVRFIAKKRNYYGSSFSDSELQLVGNAELVGAIEEYDHKRGFKFSTLAYRRVDAGICALLSKDPTVIKRLGKPAKVLKSLKDLYCRDKCADPNDVSLDCLKAFAEQGVEKELLQREVETELLKELGGDEDAASDPARSKELEGRRDELRREIKERHNQQRKEDLRAKIVARSQSQEDGFQGEFDKKLLSFANKRKKEIKNLEEHPHIGVFCMTDRQLEEAEVSLNRSNSPASMDAKVGGSDDDEEATTPTDLASSAESTQEATKREQQNREKIVAAIDSVSGELLPGSKKILLKEFLESEDPAAYLKDLDSGNQASLRDAFAENELRAALREAGFRI